MIQKSLLKNGIHFLSEVIPSRITSIGFFLGFGSIMDPEDQIGMTHLLEHMLFKGTEFLSSLELNQQLDSLGAEVNAYTDKEELVVTCTLPSENIQDILPLIEGLIFHSVFTKTNLHIEKSVVKSEILGLKDDTEDYIFEQIVKHIFKGSAYANPIAGNLKSLKRIATDDLLQHYKKMLKSATLTVSMAGSYQLKQVIPLLEKFPPLQTERISVCPRGKSINKKMVKSAEGINHFLGGWEIPPPQSLYENLLTQLLSLCLGECTSSILYHKVRDLLGISYNTYSTVQEIGETQFIFFYSTYPIQRKYIKFPKMVKNLVDENLVKITEKEFVIFKNCFKGQWLSNLERMEQVVNKNYSLFKKFQEVYSVEFLLNEIDKLSFHDFVKTVDSRKNWNYSQLVITKSPGV